MRPLLPALLLVACASGAPRIIATQPLPVRVDFEPLLASSGCEADPRFSGLYSCPAGSAMANAGCDEILRLDSLGGFTPREPIAECRKHAWQYGGLPVGEYLRGPKGIMPIYERYVALTEEGSFEILETQAELQLRYGPVDSAAEAFSFAVASSGFTEFRGFEPPASYRYFLRDLPETSVRPDGDGYVVHNLRDDSIFGCGSHPTYLVDLFVHPTGFVREVQRRRAFENPEIDGLCID